MFFMFFHIFSMFFSCFFHVPFYLFKAEQESYKKAVKVIPHATRAVPHPVGGGGGWGGGGGRGGG